MSVGPICSTQPNPTHQMTNPTQPIPEWKFGPRTQHNPQPNRSIKTTTNLLVQERELSNRSREEIRDAPNYKFTKQFDANICEICLLMPWPSMSTTLVASINSAHIKIFNFAFLPFRTHDPNPTHQKSKNLDSTQSNLWRSVTRRHGCGLMLNVVCCGLLLWCRWLRTSYLFTVMYTFVWFWTLVHFDSVEASRIWWTFRSHV